MVPYHSILLSFKRIGPLENTAGDKKKADKRDILNKRLDRKNPTWLKVGKDEDSIEKIQFLFIKLRLFLVSRELPLTLLQQYMRWRYKTVHSNKWGSHPRLSEKNVWRRDALCDQIYVQDKQQ